MKEKLTSLFLLFLAFITIFAISTDIPYPNKTVSYAETTYIPPTVSSEVIRLHILADNDSYLNQEIKLQVRDALLPYLNRITQTASTKKEALHLLQKECTTLANIANETLALLGIDYNASVSISNLYFPIRIYGSQTYLSKDAIIFPPGYYDSVQVILGSGTGHNWWCLAYPSLCFIDATYDYVPKDSHDYKTAFTTVKKSTLDNLFYGTIPKEFQNDSNVDVYFSSKILKLLANFFTD